MVPGRLKENKKKKRSIFTISMPCSDELPISSLITKTTPETKKSGRSRRQTSRKTRSKTRKPKYLSLRLQFSSTEKSQESTDSEMPSSTNTSTTSCGDQISGGSKQLQLFPVMHHPDHLAEEKEAYDENMAYLFSSGDGGASTLTGLLESATDNALSSSDHRHHQEGDNKNNDSSGTAATTATLSPSASLTYAYGGRQEDDGRLVRTALRNKEREPSEERWVRYSEVVERRDDQEVSSCAAAGPPDMMQWRRNQNQHQHQRLSLKLDYEEILTAWSDKGSLFIHAAPPPQSPQIVPDIHDEFLASQFPYGMLRHGGWGNDSSCLWRVPEFKQCPGNEGGLNLVKVKTEEQQQEQCQSVVPPVAVEEEEVVMVGEDQWKVGLREASVKRYKEKRHNRLFSKRIRYQVRKINAEKRPRLKGRFVKRS